MNIFITSFFRRHFTERIVRELKERTTIPLSIHIYDNGSDKETRDYLISLLEDKIITSLVLDSRNTGCLYNKLVFNSMVESSDEYYIVTDNDIMPPKLSPCWLTQMIKIMDDNKGLDMLCPQFPPVNYMGPTQEGIREDFVYCKAIGNALKLVRRSSYPVGYKQKLNTFGDDGFISQFCTVAFCRKVFCYHAGQSKNWGYNLDEIKLDPRKETYNNPLVIEVNPITYVPLNLTVTL
jgi:hypothetical protein